MMISPSEEKTESVDIESYEDSMDSINQNSTKMMGAAGLMKVSAQISGKEIDRIISDYENAQRLSSIKRCIIKLQSGSFE